MRLSSGCTHHSSLSDQMGIKRKRCDCFKLKKTTPRTDYDVGKHTHTINTNSPFGFFSTPFARFTSALFDLVQILLACTVWMRPLRLSFPHSVTRPVCKKHKYKSLDFCIHAANLKADSDLNNSYPL